MARQFEKVFGTAPLKMYAKNLSFWERESFLSNIDVAIIGSGLVGLSAAIHLKEKHPKLQVVIFERGALPTGASTRNAGFACFGSLTELMDDLKSQSEDEVFSLVEKRWRGLQRLRERVGDKNMDFQLNGNFELFKKEEVKLFQNCKDQLDFFNKKVRQAIGQKEKVYEEVDSQIDNFGFKNIKHLIKNNFEGQINTGKMMRRLLDLAIEKGVQILNGISIKEINDGSDKVHFLTENGWEISANRILVTTNGFSKKLINDLDVTPARNQVLITKPIENLKVKGCFHYDCGYVYFRNVGNRILLGGARNLAKAEETTDQFGTTPLIKNALLEILKTTILPNQKIEVEQWWSGILGLGNIKSPIVKMISKNVGVAVRMGGMGVAIGSLVGEEGAELMIK